MLKPPAKGKTPINKLPPRLVPRPVLFRVLCVIFAIWIGALLVMYFCTVYPLRHPGH
ncbi:MAG: hypothetical protein ABSD28_09260 [Tepidisphaeraceae bacterium]|jgi:hypothetical protein